MTKAAKAKPHVPTQPTDVGEGRAETLDRQTALAIAQASETAGFPVPPSVAAFLDDEDAPAGETAEAQTAGAEPTQPKADPAVTDQQEG